MYNIIELEQNSPEWHEFRACHIGGSDAPIVCGISPWVAPEVLWGQKMGFVEPTLMTDAMKRGQLLEPMVRDYVNKELEYDFQSVVLKSKNIKYMSASLDGFDMKEKLILEIKCPNLDTHRLAVEGHIKDYYNYQIQHCLYVSGLNKCLYVSYRKDHEFEYAFVWIERDDLIIDEILDEEKYFWNCMQNMQTPKPKKIKYFIH